MKILTTDNQAFYLNDLPREVDELRFSVLDNSDVNNPDFYFPNMIFLETFDSPAVVLDVGGFKVQMPLEYNILVGDPDVFQDPEFIPLTSINEREFNAVVLNPITSHRIEFCPIRVVNVYTDIKWHFPKMRQGQALSVPLHDQVNPPCIFFICDVPRNGEIVKLDKLF